MTRCVYSCGRVGYRGAKHKMEGCTEGGTWMGIEEGMRGRCGRFFEDHRGWGRYAGCEVQGGAGWHRHMVVIAVLGPGRDDAAGSAWVVQMEQMKILKKEGHSGVMEDPGTQLLKDLHDLLFKQLLNKKEDVAVVMGGDFNRKWSECNSGGPLSTLKGFAESLGLVNTMVRKHGST